MRKYLYSHKHSFKNQSAIIIKNKMIKKRTNKKKKIQMEQEIPQDFLERFYKRPCQGRKGADYGCTCQIRIPIDTQHKQLLHLDNTKDEQCARFAFFKCATNPKLNQPIIRKQWKDLQSIGKWLGQVNCTDSVAKFILERIVMFFDEINFIDHFKTYRIS